MLMVDARRGPSQIHGLGLIAHQSIPIGTVVWKFQLYFDQLIPPDMVDRLSPPAKALTEQHQGSCYFRMLITHKPLPHGQRLSLQ